MNTLLIDAFTHYMESQNRIGEGEERKAVLPAITISREAGAGALTIAQMVVERMNTQQNNRACPWAIFDKNLAQTILGDHDLPRPVERFLPEDSQSEIKSAFEEFLGLHPSSWSLLQYTNETIRRLAENGNAIIVGRGANIVTAMLPNVVHVRLVAPLEERIEHMMEFYQLSREDATAEAHKKDDARRRYVRHNFHANIDDTLQYHLVINTARVSYETAAQLIADAALRAVEKLQSR